MTHDPARPTPPLSSPADPSPPSIPATPTIGVFDSGFGGLTVLRALLDLHPHARFLYLGDTARLPYGSKSQATVARYAVSSAQFLLAAGADLLVIACNTASALALDEIRAAAYPTPVLGVITPGAQAALALETPSPTLVISTAAPQTPVLSTAAPQTPVLSTEAPQTSPISTEAPQTSPVSTDATQLPVISTEAKRSGETRFSTEAANPSNAATVIVLATTATVASGAYTAALATLGLTAHEKACPLLVPLVEEGWTDHPVTAEVARIYLAEALAEAPQATTLLLGCTHYPLLAPLLARTAAALGHPLHLVDSAHATAYAVHAILGPQPTPTGCTPELYLYATDSVEKFQRLGSAFLGRPLPPVQLITLPE